MHACARCRDNTNNNNNHKSQITNHKSQNGKIKVYIQMRRQQQQWEGKEKKNSSHELRTLLGISTEQDLLFSLSLSSPPKKPRRLCTTTTTTTTTHIDHSIFLTFSDSYRHTYIPLFLRLRVSGVYVCVYTASFFYSLPLTLLAQSSRTRIASTTSISFPRPTKLECSHHFFFFSLVRCC